MRERVITTTLAEIAARHGLEGDLLRLLVMAAADAQPPSPKLAKPTVQRLPTKGVELAAEGRFGYKWSIRERTAELWYRKEDRKPKGQHFDWVFRSQSEGIVVAVEVKITTLFGNKQLQRYAAALTRNPELRPIPHKGLLVLCTTKTSPSRHDLEDTGRHLLGVVLWKDVMTGLRALAPADPQDRQLWFEILDYVSDVDPDCGAVRSGASRCRSPEGVMAYPERFASESL